MDEISALLNAVSSSPEVKEKLRFRNYGFGTKGDPHPLEAADLLLWAYHKLHVDYKACPDYVKNLAATILRIDRDPSCIEFGASNHDLSGPL